MFGMVFDHLVSRILQRLEKLGRGSNSYIYTTAHLPPLHPHLLSAITISQHEVLSKHRYRRRRGQIKSIQTCRSVKVLSMSISHFNSQNPMCGRSRRIEIFPKNANCDANPYPIPCYHPIYMWNVKMSVGWWLVGRVYHYPPLVHSLFTSSPFLLLFPHSHRMLVQCVCM